MDQTDIINQITWQMRERGIDRARLAYRMNVEPGRVAQILSGGESLTLNTINAVARALGCRLELTLV